MRIALCLLLAAALPASAIGQAAPAPPARICGRLAPDGSANEAARLQAALDRCGPNGRLILAGGRFPSGPLRLPSGVTLQIARGATLAALPDPTLYDRGQGRCGTIDAAGGGCRALLTIAGARDSSIFGPGTIDGMGGARMAGRAESWWQLARRAQQTGGKQNAPRLIQITAAQRIVLARLRLTDAPNFHVALDRVRGFLAWGLVIDTPAFARNTDGIDPASSSDVTIVHSYISDGDDDVAIKAGPQGPSRRIRLYDDHFYAGHGLSIGSQTEAGVSDVRARGLSFDGTTWGLRFKSAPGIGGPVQTVRYEDVCLRGSRFPISITSNYAGGPAPVAGLHPPRFSDIVLAGIAGSAGRLVIEGLDASDPAEVSLNGLAFGNGSRWQIANARLAARATTPPPPGARPLAAGPRAVPDCAGRFPPLPAAPP